MKILSETVVNVWTRNRQNPEPVLNHEIPEGPWIKVATDLFNLYNEKYVLVVDYFSSYVEIAKLRNESAKCVTDNIKIYIF